MEFLGTLHWYLSVSAALVVCAALAAAARSRPGAPPSPARPSLGPALDANTCFVALELPAVDGVARLAKKPRPVDALSLMAPPVVETRQARSARIRALDCTTIHPVQKYRGELASRRIGEFASWRIGEFKNMGPPERGVPRAIHPPIHPSTHPSTHPPIHPSIVGYSESRMRSPRPWV